MVGAGNIVHEKFTARYRPCARDLFLRFIIVKLFAIPFKDNCRSWMALYPTEFIRRELVLKCVLDIFDRPAVNFSQLGKSTASDQGKFNVQREDLRGCSSQPITGLSETVAYVRNGSCTCTIAFAVCEEPPYRLAQPWKIEFTIINAAYGGDRAAIRHNETGIDARELWSDTYKV